MLWCFASSAQLRIAGYSYTIGTGGASVMKLIERSFAPALLGRDAAEVERIWRDLMFLTHATTVGAITAIAQAAIDTALWDLRCRKAGLPLHVMAGGAQLGAALHDRRRLVASGTKALVDDALRAKETGFGGVRSNSAGRTSRGHRPPGRGARCASARRWRS